MGRQINFFMLPEDEEEFIRFVKSTGEVIVIPAITNKMPVESVENLPKAFSKPYWFSFYFLNKNLIEEAKYDYIEKQKHYHIDESKSLVIQFHRGGIEDNKILEGRIWIATAYVIKDSSGELVWVQKSKEFIEWYEKIARWLRKNYLKNGSIYISKRVLEWLKKGDKLSTGIGQVFTLEDLERWKRYAEKEKQK